MNFSELLEKVGKEISDRGYFRVITHLDTDGICSGAIMIKTLQRLNKDFHLSVVDLLDEELIARLSSEEYDNYIFTDLGSGQLNLLKEVPGKVYVFDHHQIVGDIPDNVTLVNPLRFNLPPFSGSTVTYLFSKTLGNDDLALLAAVGAVGDRQEPIKEVLEDAGIVEREDLRIYGKHLKPCYRALSSSVDPIIPGLFNDDGASVEFLKAIDIEPEKRIAELNEEEKKRLVAGIILRRKDLDDPEDVFGRCFYSEKLNMDLDEFSTLINAFSRLGRTGDALRLCLNPTNDHDEVLREYRREIGKLISESKENMEIKGDLVLFTCSNSRMVGTITSLLLSEFGGKVIVGMAPRGKYYKISVRTNKDLNLGETLSKLAEELGGEGGGHDKAGGAIIPMPRLDAFKKRLEATFGREESDFLLP